MRSWVQVLETTSCRIAEKGPKWSDPSLDPAQVGATCTGLSFFLYVYVFAFDADRIMGIALSSECLLNSACSCPIGLYQLGSGQDAAILVI
jgi:hypothetical protein